MLERKLLKKKLNKEELLRKKAIVSLIAFLSEQLYIVNIVKFCNMYNIPSNQWRIWQDDFGFILSVDDNKEVTIKRKRTNELFYSKDLYAFAPKDQLLEISKIIVTMPESKLYWAKNDIWRYRKIVDGTEMSFSPLSLPLDSLKNIISTNEDSIIKLSQNLKGKFKIL